MNSSNFDTNTFSIKNQLPHNFLAEQMILSNLLISPEAIEKTKNILLVESFYFTNHQKIYRAILDLYFTKRHVDILNLITYIQDQGLLEEIGGIQVLIELLSQTPNLTYLEDHLSLVKEKFLRRRLIKLGYELINSSYLTNLSLENILTELEEKVFNLTLRTSTQNLQTSGELLNSIFFDLKEKSLNPTFLGLASGFHELDSLTQGFQKSDLIILAGRPSMGKTAFSLNITLNVLQQSKMPVLFFTLEMSKEQIIYRLLSIVTQINQIRLKSGQLSQADWVKITKTIRILSKLPFFIDDTANLSINDIQSKIKTIFFEQKTIGLVIIDYLQLMKGEGNEIDNRAQTLAQITRSLKILAREFNVPIIALSQLSRSVENRPDKRPLLSDLRESGSIEQDADLVLMLSKDQQLEPDTIELILAKHRNGPTGNLKLFFDKNSAQFLDF